MSCRRWAYVVPAVALLVLSAVAQAGAVEQTRPWRIGVSGSYCSGYWGMLGRLGLPRERLLEQRVWEADYLKQFDVVLMGSAWGDSYRTSRAVEQFVYGGGIAVTEYTVWPSPSVLPGDRYGDRRTPNMRFVESDCPASKGLPQLGIIYTSRRNGVSIFPTPGRPDTYEIARYTDRGAPSDVTGGFRTGSGDAPAMLLFRYGKGWWLWCGTQMSYQTALRDSEFVPAILNALDFASGGELKPVSLFKTGAPVAGSPVVKRETALAVRHMLDAWASDDLLDAVDRVIGEHQDRPTAWIACAAALARQLGLPVASEAAASATEVLARASRRDGVLLALPAFECQGT